jgi:hypothetical protein
VDLIKGTQSPAPRVAPQATLGANPSAAASSPPASPSLPPLPLAPAAVAAGLISEGGGEVLELA